MRARRSGLVVAVGCVAVLLGVTSTAWACFAPGTDPVVRLSSNRVTAGSRITVTGANWAPQSLSVHLGSASWATAGSPDDGSFAVTITVPEMAPDLYYVRVTQPGASPEKAVSLVVESSRSTGGGATGDPTSTANATTGAGAAGAATPETPAVAAATPAPASGPSSAETSTSGLPTATSQTAAPVAGAASRPVPATTGPAARAQAARAGGAPASGMLPSVAPKAAAQATEAPAAAPAARSASGESAWSGFEKGVDSSTPTLVNPTARSASGPSQAMLGLGMLMAGLVAMFAGFCVAELRRRTAPVTGKH